MNQYLDSFQEISLKTMEGFTFYKYTDIVRFEADGNNTLVYLMNEDKPQKVLHTFAEVEEKVFGIALFFKCQRSHIVNINHIKRFCTKLSLLITEKGEVPISESHAKEFKERYCK